MRKISLGLLIGFVLALLMCVKWPAQAHNAQSSPYTPPNLPPIFSAADMANMATLNSNVNANVASYTQLLTAHDQQIASLTVRVAALEAKLAPVTPTLTASAQSIPVVPYTSIAGAIPATPICSQIICNTLSGENITYTLPNTEPPGKFSFTVNGSGPGTIVINVNGQQSPPLTFPSGGPPQSVTLTSVSSFNTFSVTWLQSWVNLSGNISVTPQ